MKGNKRISSAGRIVTALFMLITLACLTVSIPFKYTGEQIKKQLSEVQCTEGDCDDPFSKCSEEKSESGVGTLSEYLHEFHLHESVFSIIAKYYKCHPSGLYFAFHPDLISPPPEA